LDGRREWISALAIEALRSVSVRDASTRLREAEEQRNEARADATAERVRLESLEQNLGAPWQELQELLAELRRSRQAGRADVSRLDASEKSLAKQLGELNGARRRAEADRDASVGRRDVAAAAFRLVASSTLADDAELTIAADDRVRSTLDAVRAVAATLSIAHTEKDIASALQNLTEAVHNSRQQLSERADLEMVSGDGAMFLTALIDGLRVSAATLLRQLREERERGQNDITAAERELFDKTLTGDTRRHLADRIRQASGLVERMNSNLGLVRTASAVAVKLAWQVDPSLPEGTKEARELLLKDPVRLSDADHEALHRFFRDRVEEARQANTAATWEQQLTEVFDYTKWHRFVVKLDRGNGEGWQDLTKRLHGALSGGEKAIALHLPLFTAVAAHYETEPTAPRLILLDEVFVGVDTANRGQVFALLTALNLDLVLTSDHEWCTYRELPGIAIHQLLGDDNVVTSARFVWNGRQLVSDEPEDEAFLE
jgi:hypothetical protein